MASHTAIGKAIVPLVIAALSLCTSCDKLEDAVESSKTRIVAHLTQQGIYERNNVPENVSPTAVKGYYDIIGGAYRYITNENRAGRGDEREIAPADSVSFYFDARIFSSSYDNSATYFTNIASRIEYISNNNPQFNASQWSTDSLRIKVGGDPRILNSIQNTLPSCRVGDVVRIFLPPDVAYGSKQVDVVPAKSTLAFELTDIKIIE